MRMTLSSTVLANRLIALQKVQNSKNSLQILDCILFSVSNGKLQLTASDKENEMKIDIELDECDVDGKFAISSKTITDAVKELPEQPITIEIDENTYSVKVLFQNGDYKFTAQNADEFPQSQDIQEGANSIKIASNVLLENITRTIFATANDEIRPVMNGIFFDLTPEALAIVATDGHKMVRNKILTISGQESASFILPKKPAGILKNTLAHDDSEVEIKFDDRNAEILFGDYALKCRLIEGRYPNYNSVIPNNNPYELNIDRKTLAGSVRRVLPFASESSQLERLHLTSGEVEISAEDLDFYTSAKESIVCDYNGNTMNIGFKGSSLLELLNNLNCDEVSLRLADPSRPCLILPSEQPEGQDILMLIMPMLLND